jgi:predicted ester cyclase
LPESNADLARRWFEQVWNLRRDATVHELLHSGGIGHIEGADVHGPEEFLAARAALLGAFPDLRVTVEATVSEGPDVVVRWSAKGTHGGDGLGFAATARQALFRGMTWLRFSNGQVVEGWDSWNLGQLLQDLRTPAANVGTV